MLTIVKEPPHCCPSTRLERLRVWLHNFRVRKTGRAYRHLCKAMKDNPSYAHTWKCNLEIQILYNCPLKNACDANRVADILMKHLFNVDTKEK